MQTSNLLFLNLLGISTLTISVSCDSSQKAEKKPNIVFIMTDDHAWQAISAYNHPLSRLAPTPHIDRLAREGMLFDRCLITNSICGPSRATLLTGKYSHLNGMYRNPGRLQEFDGSQQTFPKIMREYGYQTAIIGKWHLHSEPTGFDHWDILPGQGHYYNPDFITEKGTYQEYGYITDIITDKSLAWISEASQKDKPFAILIHHKAPHRDWEPAIKYLGHFNGIVFPEPATLFDNYDGLGQAAREQDMSILHSMRVESDLKMWTDTTLYMNMFDRSLGRLDSTQRQAWDSHYDPIIKDFYSRQFTNEELLRWKYQRYMQEYLTTILSVDESVGRVLDYLEETGLDKNTMIVYTSDQGFFLGEKGWFDKRFMYEESLRTPLFVKWKGVTRPGRVNRDIVSNLDFAQTFLDIAGIPIPEDMQGSSLVPLLKGKTPENWRKEHYYHYYEYPGSHSVKRHYGITTDRYKLMHFYYDIDEWEMYDLEKDPMELQNIYHLEESKVVRDELHQQLNNLMEKYQDSEELRNSMLPT
jgi:arylsulfatase A-like enzyme